MECGPGEEGQVDFGTGAPIIAADGKAAKQEPLPFLEEHPIIRPWPQTVCNAGTPSSD